MKNFIAGFLFGVIVTGGVAYGFPGFSGLRVEHTIVYPNGESPITICKRMEKDGWALTNSDKSGMIFIRIK